MHPCLRFPFFVLLFVMLGRTLLGEGGTSQSHLSVRQQADSIVHNLKQNLSAVTLDADRLNLLVRSKKDIQDLRLHNPMQFRTDEAYLNSLESGLNVLTSKEDFKKSNCDAYRAALLGKLSAKSESRKPASTVLDVLDKVCL